MSEVKPSTLYVVATPIGNLEDITLRALKILKGVDIIACEDTRHSLKLLNHYNISKKLISYHSHNEKNSARGIIKLLNENKSIALITDGGTPCISDPGVLLVRQCLEENINVITIPGPTALIALLASSGFRSDKFCFHGFLSPKTGKQKRQLTDMVRIEGTHIIYEGPHRILKLIENIFIVFPKKSVCIGKELTKINEKIITGSQDEIKALLEKEKIVGEYVILIANY